MDTSDIQLFCLPIRCLCAKSHYDEDSTKTQISARFTIHAHDIALIKCLPAIGCLPTNDGLKNFHQASNKLSPLNPLGPSRSDWRMSYILLSWFGQRRHNHCKKKRKIFFFKCKRTGQPYFP